MAVNQAAMIMVRRISRRCNSRRMSHCICVLTFYAVFVPLMLIEIMMDPYPIGILPHIPRNGGLDQWLSRYPLIESQRVSKCDRWKCQPTFNHTTNEWLDQYIAFLPEETWRKDHKSQSEELLDPNQQCQNVFIGDSITDQWRRNQKIFDRTFNQNRNGVIYAQGGDRVHEIGWRLNQGDGFKNMKNCMLNHKSPQKSIILNIGTNDVGHFTIPYDVALRDYDVLLNQFAEFLEDINTEQRVVLNVMAIFPRGCRETPSPQCELWNGDNTMFENINFMNEYLKSFIERQKNDNMRFVDCNRYLLQRIGSVDWTDNKGGIHRFLTGYINTTILPDRLHLSATGYELWAECLYKQLK